MFDPESEKKKSKTYRYCFAYGCKSTSVESPDKYFFRVPSNPELRRKWCDILRTASCKPLAPTTSHYCCGDHFNLEKDVLNMVKYKLVGGTLLLKPDALPIATKLTLKERLRGNSSKCNIKKKKPPKIKTKPIQQEAYNVFENEEIEIKIEPFSPDLNPIENVEETNPVEKITVVSTHTDDSYNENNTESQAEIQIIPNISDKDTSLKHVLLEKETDGGLEPIAKQVKIEPNSQSCSQNLEVVDDSSCNNSQEKVTEFQQVFVCEKKSNYFQEQPPKKSSKDSWRHTQLRLYTDKACSVPNCYNNMKKTPDKFFYHPTEEQIDIWCRAAKRRTPPRFMYCCQDHFDMEKDFENAMYHRFMGGQLKLKSEAVPSKFDCQACLEDYDIDRLNKILDGEYEGNYIEEENVAHSQRDPVEGPKTPQIRQVDKSLQVSVEDIGTCGKTKLFLGFTKNKGNQVRFSDFFRNKGTQVKFNEVPKLDTIDKLPEVDPEPDYIGPKIRVYSVSKYEMSSKMIIPNVKQEKNKYTDSERNRDDDITAVRACRICLAMGVRLYNVLKAPYKEFYEEIVNEQVSSEDGLPEYICFECATRLKNHYEFKGKCMKARGLLLTTIAKGKQITTRTIKKINRKSQKLESNLKTWLPDKGIQHMTLDEIEPTPEIVPVQEFHIVPFPEIEIKIEKIEPDDIEQVNVIGQNEEDIIDEGESSSKDKKKSKVKRKWQVKDPDFQVEDPDLQVENPDLQAEDPDFKAEEDSSSESSDYDPEMEFEDTPVRKIPKTCPDCGEYFETTTDFLKHYKEFHKDGTALLRHVCELCGYRTKSISSFKNHMTNHTGERPFKCDTCNYFFKRKSRLNDHLKTKLHFKEKPYQCSNCDMKFPSKINLTKHLQRTTKYMKKNPCTMYRPE